MSWQADVGQKPAEQADTGGAQPAGRSELRGDALTVAVFDTT